MANESSGTFVIANAGEALNSFPKEFKRSLFSNLDPKFTLIFAICAVVILGTVFVLSLRKTADTVSEKEILKIQERYARLVLNQPKPAEPTVEKVTEGVKTEGTKPVQEEEKKDVPQVDREKETFVEKQQRKAAGTEERRQKRAEVAQQIQSSGIFAAITATGSSGGSSSGITASDLLGNANEGIADIGSINISKGTFAAKKVEGSEIVNRKDSRTTEVGIEKQDIGKAAVATVASVASVNISSAAPEITGESSSLSDRSQATVQRIVSREAQRLKRVYEEWLKRDPSLNGNLTVKFVIMPSGAVSTVSIVKSTTNNAEFDETIVRYIKRWQFPAVDNGSPVEVVYPFVFEGQS